jgi:hypothetical protein
VGRCSRWEMRTRGGAAKLSCHEVIAAADFPPSTSPVLPLPQDIGSASAAGGRGRRDGAGAGSGRARAGSQWA